MVRVVFTEVLDQHQDLVAQRRQLHLVEADTLHQVVEEWLRVKEVSDNHEAVRVIEERANGLDHGVLELVQLGDRLTQVRLLLRQNDRGVELPILEKRMWVPSF